ncbi:Lysosomal-trafficking regulator [Toxocara canis]|uniref:Lysosomal-trafficking regulator n=1 Tax=Toxocara canis TaxID=6265 RepID=A0A0B2VZM6_TOXCA|nr:Lysosomal-trafficking regulator [Toxocara canis]
MDDADHEGMYPRRLQGWHLRLLGCLAEQLSHSDLAHHRTSTLLSLVSHLQLNPNHGNSCHVRVISDSLTELVSSASLCDAVSQPQPEALLHALSNLQCTPFVVAVDYDDDDDAKTSCPVSSRRRDIPIFFSEYLLHEDSDGFAVMLKDHPPQPAGDCYDLDDATLYILHDTCIDDVPLTYSLFESIAYALSIIPRISNFTTNNRFADIITNFANAAMPDVNEMKEFSNWTVLASLLVKGALVAAKNEIRIQRKSNSLLSLIKFSTAFTKHVADNISYGLNGGAQSVNVDWNGASDFCALFEHLFRFLAWTLDAVALPLSVSVDADRQLSNCLLALSVLLQERFLDTVRDACVLADEVGLNNGGSPQTFHQFLDSLATLCCSLSQTADQLRRSNEEADTGIKKKVRCRPAKVTHMRHSSATDLETGLCAFAYLFQICSDMAASCTHTTMLDAIIGNVAKLPAGFCSCVNTSSIISSLIVEPYIDVCPQSIPNALIVHLRPSEGKCAIEKASSEVIDLLVRRVRSMSLVNANYILRLLSITFPYLLCSDAERLCETLVSRCLELDENSSGEGVGESETLRNLIVLFLSSNIVGQRASSMITETLLIPFLKRTDDCSDDFSIFFPLFRAILLSDSTPTAHAKELCSALCSRMERDLSVARSDIWTLIAATEFSVLLLSVSDLLYAFLSRYELPTLPDSLVKRLRTCSGVFIDVCLDWIHAPNADFSQMHRIGRLLAISLATVLSCEKGSPMAKELCSALCSRMERDLSVARSDIWTLIAATEFSVLLLSVSDLLYAFLSRYELPTLPDSLVKRLRTCSGVFIDVCLDWIHAPNADFSQMHRIGRLLAISLATVLSCEKGSPMMHFMEQLEKDMIDSIQDPISFRLLYCLVSAFFDFSMAPLLAPRRCAQDCSHCQRVESVVEHEAPERRTVLHAAICRMGVNVLANGVKRCGQLLEYDEYCVKRLCKMLESICLMSRSNMDTLLAANAKELCSALCSRMERDLSVARSDIWTLIAATEFSVLLLSVSDLLYAFLSRYELPTLPDSLVKRLRTCSGVFIDVCLDWIHAPNADFSQMHRIGRLLAISLATVLSCEKGSPMMHFMEQLEKDMIDSIQDPISFRLLYCLVSAFFDFSMAPLLAPRRCAQDCSHCQRVESVVEHEAPERRTVLHAAICRMGVNVLANGVKRCGQLLEYDEYCVKRLCKMLESICLMSRSNMDTLLAANVLSPWLSLIENLIERSVSVNCLNVVLGIYSAFISVDAQPAQLKALIKLIRKAPHLQLAVLETLLDMVRANAVEPSECMVFPQNALAEIPPDDEGDKLNIGKVPASNSPELTPATRSLVVTPSTEHSSFEFASSPNSSRRGDDRFVHWLHLAEAVAVCLSDTFARCYAFNRAQLVRVRFITELFKTCNEMLQDAANFRLGCDDAMRLVKSLTVTISCLLGSPETADAVTFLWHFILLSHPAADAFLQYHFCGHNDWLKNVNVKELHMDVIGRQSALAVRLSDYVRLLGAGYIADAWTRQRSVISLRQAYEVALERGVTKGEYMSDASSCGQSSTVSQSRSVLPDLVKGIETDIMQEDEEIAIDRRQQQSVQRSGNQLDDQYTDWIGALRCGAIELLSVVIQNAPDSLILALLHDAVSWQSIIVLLSNQEDVTFRDSVFLLLENVLLRSPSAVRASFVKNNGFAILSNHIRSHPITESISNALFALLCGERVRLDEGLDSAHIQSTYVDGFTCAAFDAIFVMWEESVNTSDLSVFWNITSALLKVRRKVFFSDARHYEMCQRLIWLLQYALLDFSRGQNEQQKHAEAVIRRELCSLLSCWLFTLQNVYLDEGLSASIAPSTESINTVNSSPSPSFAFRDEHFEDIESEGISPSLASALQGVSPMASFFTDSFTNLRERISSLGTQMKCRYKWRYRVQLPAPSENTNRVLFCIEACSHLFTAIPVADSETASEAEHSLFQQLLSFLFSTWKKDPDVLAIRSGGAHTWANLLAACRDRARLLLGQLIAFVLFPAERKLCERLSGKAPCFAEHSDWALSERLMLVRSLANDLPYKNTLKTLLDINLDYQYAMNLALHELALVESCLSVDSVRDVEKLIRFLRNIQIESPLANLTPERLMSLTTDETLALHGYVDHRNSFIRSLRERVTALYNDETTAAEPISNIAMSLTCEVVDEQNLSRKLFLRSCRSAETSCIYAERIISSLSVQLCHPEAVCFDESSWPLSWALDPTEGPNRERRRLKPDHLNFDRRFVLPEFANKLSNRERPFPLSNLLSGRRTSPKGWNMMETLADDERIRVSLPARVVRSTVESIGEVLLGDVKFYFFGDNTRSTQKGVSYATAMIVVWEYSAVVEVYKRHHLLKDVAVEIFLSDGQTFLIVFDEQTSRDHFMSQLLSMDLCSLISSPHNLHSFTQLWREGGMSNFEYLMQLNKLAGRSFNDLMQYPVFPFILSNYSSTIIDLTDASSYRNLSKPMAVQNKRMEGHYQGVYACLEAEAKRLSHAHNSPINFGPYHYGSHYSNSGIVVHYLVRLPPFTDIALEYQDNNFDIADRLFNSIETTWRLSSSESTTDFKELIPEFFYLPEFLLNNEHLNMGVRQNGDVVNDVVLPKWCAGSARLFILIHRQALESSIVTANLHSWIDLIFGYKQTGQAAIQAINVFHPAALESSIVTANLHSWIDLIFGYKQTGQAAIQAINVFHPATYRGGIQEETFARHDPLSLSALRTMVRTYGQMPTQLLLSPHLPHLTAKSNQFSKRKSPSVIDSVLGVRWGEFVGSPESEAGTPVVVLKQRGAREMGHISHLLVTPDGSCYAFPDKTLFLPNVTAIAYSIPKGLLFVALSPAVLRVYRISFTADYKVGHRSFELSCSALLSWRFADTVMRFRLLGTSTPFWINLIDLQSFSVTAIAYSIPKGLLFVALSPAVLRVYRISFTADGLEQCKFETTLYGHESALCTISVCSEYAVAVSGCSEGKVCLWDSNRLSFVRTLVTPGSEAAKLTCISSVTCDVAVVFQSGYGSRVCLYTVNGDRVGCLETDITVTALGMTSLPEGTAVNCLALGMQNGIVRLLDMWMLNPVRDIFSYSFLEPIVRLLDMWMLNPVRDIFSYSFLEPIVSMSFASRCTRLFVCLASGRVLCWQGEKLQLRRPPSLTLISANAQ